MSADGYNFPLILKWLRDPLCKIIAGNVGCDAAVLSAQIGFLSADYFSEAVRASVTEKV